jgi:hypothetical protein
LVQVVWGFLLNVLWRGVKKDLVAMEEVTMSTALDYLLVRSTGLDPPEPIIGKWKAITAKGEKVAFSFYTVSKSDVGLFMLGEACKPSMHSTAVTLGGSEEAT